MYLHPQETSYDLKRLWQFVEAAGLEFLGFSNPEQWDPARLLKGELLERAQQLPERERWLLIESLDPEISHLEFFVSNQPIQRQFWHSDAELLAARPQRSVCLWGWPSAALLNRDMAPLQLSPDQMLLLQAMEQPEAHGLSLAQLPLDWSEQQRCAVARELLAQAVLLLGEAD